ncbi:MAG: phosphotransferase, partial [Oscillospiraceae bacterium]|nr:phosphotransferase [Oscillospiraceae bacterium]
MRSNTKSKLNDDSIKKIVSSHFPNANVEKIVELKGGMFNSAYAISLSEDLMGHGKEFVLKVSVASTTKVLTYEKDLMYAEVQVFKKMLESGVPVPHIVAEDFSQSIVPYNYFIMTKLQGIEWQEGNKYFKKEDVSNLKFELGRCLAQTHSNKGEYYGYVKDDKEFQFSSWRQAYTSMLNNIVKDGKKDNVKLPYDKVLETVEPFLPLLDEVTEPSLVNFDLWAKNIFVEKRDGVYCIEGIIDLERAFYGDPFADFVASFAIYNDISKEPDIQRGYESVTGKPFVISRNDEI